MSRTERLLNLTSALLSAQRPISAEELHETIPGYPEDKTAFRRQFERDKDALRQLGLPITVQPVPGGLDDNRVGYRIRPEEYFVRDPGLEPDELSALHLAAQVARLGGARATAALWKLGLADSSTSNDVAAVAGDDVDDGPLPKLFQAIADQDLVEFTYRGERRSVTGRQLSFRNGHWYLSAFDHGRRDDRSFRVDRIEAPLTVTDSTSSLPPMRVTSSSAFDAPWELGDGNALATRVRIDAPHSRWARERLGSSAVVEDHPDGSTTFAFAVRNVDAFRSFVLGFLDHAVIEDPAELRHDLLRWVESGAGS